MGEARLTVCVEALMRSYISGDLVLVLLKDCLQALVVSCEHASDSTLIINLSSQLEIARQLRRYMRQITILSVYFTRVVEAGSLHHAVVDCSEACCDGPLPYNHLLLLCRTRSDRRHEMRVNGRRQLHAVVCVTI